MKRIFIILILFPFLGSSQVITTIAGNGVMGFSGDGGQATAAKLSANQGVVVDKNGNVFIADVDNQRIRKVDTMGIISTIAGNGVMGSGGDGGPATNGQLSDPYSLAVDTAGNIYIADYVNDRVRKVSASGIITTIAGNGILGFGGDGGPATAAQLYGPLDVAVDNSGNVYIADYINDRIRKVNALGIITTIAGNGILGYSGDGGPATAANLHYPYGVAVDGTGNLFIADKDNNCIRKVNTGGFISTIAGNGTLGFSGDGGSATSATLKGPIGVAVDGSGNVYISDLYNQRIRKVNASGSISTLAGNGTSGFSGDGGPSTAAELNDPYGISVDNNGNVYVGDYSNNRIRKIKAPIFSITGASDVCIGFTTTLSDSTIGGTWSSSNTAFATIGSITGIVMGVSVGISVITYNVSGNFVTDTVTVHSLPSAGSITGTSSVCAGSTITLIDAIAGGAWSSSNASATVSGGIVTGVSAGIDTISYSVTNMCGMATATKIITVNPLPLAGTITGLSSVCAGSAIVLTDAVTGGLWSSSNTTAAMLGGVVTGITAGVDTISYSVTNMCGMATVTKIIAVNTLPLAGTITGLSGVCVGSTITLTDAATGGIWSSSNATAIVSGGIVTGVSAGTDTISYRVTNMCGIATATKIITVNPLPLAGTITGLSGVCVGSTITLTDAATGGIWSSSNATAIVSGGIVTGVSAGIDTISYSVTNMCGIATASKTITVNPLPSAGTIMGSSNVCVGSTITLTDVAPGGVWNSSNATAIVSGGIVTGVSAGADTINYTVTNMCGIATTNKTITINQLPSAGTITGLSNVCVGSIIILTDTITGGLWSSSNATAIISGGMVTGVSAGIDTISYTVTNICGSVSVNAIIKINYSDSPIIIKNGNVLYAPSGYSSYQWQLNGVPISGATLFSYIPTSLGDYNLIVTNSFGCIGFSEPIHITQCNVDDILIYPNPCESIVYIQWCGAVTLRLTCMDGKSLKAIENVNELDLGDLPNGAYLLTIFDLYGNKLKTKLITKLAK